MDKILENKFVVIAAVVLFVMALGANTLMGGAMPSFAGGPTISHSATLTAHGPTLPPEPWDNSRVAHGPTLPPEPWDGRLGHGPTLPPEPWVRGC